MAFNRDYLARIGTANTNAPAIWLYASADDTAATINTSGYFNDATKELRVNDWILVSDSANAHVVTYVASNASGVVDIVDGTAVTATDTD